MKSQDIEYLCRFLKERLGLVLPTDRAYLLQTRLPPVAQKFGMKSVEELAAAMRLEPTEKLLQEVADAMTTNESFFFRDGKPFEEFRDFVIPYLRQARAAEKSIRIWSAGCSSGQEPYSLAMLFRDMAGQFLDWKVNIVATDVSERILARAREGKYTTFEVERGLSPVFRDRYFKQEKDDTWRIDPPLRAMVEFRPFNLLHDCTRLGPFDVIFCRNVLIYFDSPTKVRILNRLRHQTAKDGFLFLGTAETVMGLGDDFDITSDRRGLYRPKPELASMSDERNFALKA